MGDIDLIPQYMSPDEQLLFSTDKVELKPPAASVLLRSRVDTRHDGALAITDKRLLVVHKGFVGPTIVLGYYYDAGYIKQQIQAAAGAGAVGSVMVLTGVEQKHGMIGGDYLVLQTAVIDLGAGGQTTRRFMKKFVTRDLKWELYIRKPLTISSKLAAAGVTVAVLPVGWAFATLINHFKGRGDITFQPIVEIMQMKSVELAGLKKDLDALAAGQPVPSQPQKGSGAQMVAALGDEGKVAFCSNCGKDLPEGATFCPACGTPVQAPASSLEGTNLTPLGYLGTVRHRLAKGTQVQRIASIGQYHLDIYSPGTSPREAYRSGGAKGAVGYGRQGVFAAGFETVDANTIESFSSEVERFARKNKNYMFYVTLLVSEDITEEAQKYVKEHAGKTGFSLNELRVLVSTKKQMLYYNDKAYAKNQLAPLVRTYLSFGNLMG